MASQKWGGLPMRGDSSGANIPLRTASGHRAADNLDKPSKGRSQMAKSSQSAGRPITVGLIADQTGPLSSVGQANANVARMVIGDINAKGGLLGSHVELLIEDSQTTDAAAGAAAAKVVALDGDLIIGGIYSSTRQFIKAEAVTKGRKLYISPEQYEGEESDPYIFCT